MKVNQRSQLLRYIDELAEIELSTPAFNQYAHGGSLAAGNAIRRRNLLLYFQQMMERRPETVLIGEAPSYRGCRLTGVPFVSESILLCGVEPIGMFGHDRGYRRSNEFERLSTEASATIVWATIRDVRPLPLLWNAFPFHPYRDGNQRTNRMPGKRELVIGQPLIRRLLELFGVGQVIAVGNRAGHTLTMLGIPHTRVRHPSQGGKVKFVEGLRAQLARSSVPA